MAASDIGWRKVVFMVKVYSIWSQNIYLSTVETETWSNSVEFNAELLCADKASPT